MEIHNDNHGKSTLSFSINKNGLILCLRYNFIIGTDTLFVPFSNIIKVHEVYFEGKNMLEFELSNNITKIGVEKWVILSFKEKLPKAIRDSLGT